MERIRQVFFQTWKRRQLSDLFTQIFWFQAECYSPASLKVLSGTLGCKKKETDIGGLCSGSEKSFLRDWDPIYLSHLYGSKRSHTCTYAHTHTFTHTPLIPKGQACTHVYTQSHSHLSHLYGSSMHMCVHIYIFSMHLRTRNWGWPEG